MGEDFSKAIDGNCGLHQQLKLHIQISETV